MQLLTAPAYMQACAKINIAPPEVVSTTDSGAKTLRYLALGDSYTIGQGVQQAERYPAQTAEKLKAYGLLTGTPEYIATSGWTTTDLLSGITFNNPAGPYDAVTLLIGVNDQYQHRDTTSYRQNFTGCLQKSIALAGNLEGHVFVLSIPDYGVTPFGGGSADISREIDMFNAINKEITIAHGVVYINITDLTKAMGNDPTLVADGLHPSGKEYGLWAERLVPAIQAAYK